MRDGLMAPKGELGDIDVVSNVVLLRGAAGTVLIDTAAGGLDAGWEGATATSPPRSRRTAAWRTSTRSSSPISTSTTSAARRRSRRRASSSRRPPPTGRAAWEAEPGGMSEVFARIEARLDEVADGAEVLPGVRLVEAPGHRAGHASSRSRGATDGACSCPT